MKESGPSPRTSPEDVHAAIVWKWKVAYMRRRRSSIGIPLAGAAIVLLCLVCVVVGRVGDLPFFCPHSLPPIEVSGMRRLAIPAPCSLDFRVHCPGVLDAILPLNTPQRPTPLAADLLISRDGAFYTVRLSDERTQHIALPLACAGVLALGDDRRTLACVGWTVGCLDCLTVCTDCFGQDIEAVALDDANVTHSTVLVAPHSDISFGVLSWSPDERHLAVVRREGGEDGTCALAIYTNTFGGESVNSPLTLTGLLTLDGAHLCDVRQIAWSPDGGSIALIETAYDRLGALYLLSLAALPPGILAAPTGVTPITRTITPPVVATFQALAVDPLTATPFMAWTPDARALTFTTAGGARLVSLDLATGLQHLVLALPRNTVPIQRFAWLPGTRTLALSAGKGGGENCAAPPDDLYTYAAPPLDAQPVITPTVPTLPAPTPTPPPIFFPHGPNPPTPTPALVPA
jgi:hypothetical protein